MNRPKQPLYRKINKTAHGLHINDPGGRYADERHTKTLTSFDEGRKSIGHTRTGYDYSPLFKFLLSKVGQPFDQVHSEAISRLDKEEPIFYMVAKNELDRIDFFCTDESSYWSKLYIDEDGILKKVNPGLSEKDIAVRCKCCTYSLNGIVIKNTCT